MMNQTQRSLMNQTLNLTIKNEDQNMIHSSQATIKVQCKNHKYNLVQYFCLNTQQFICQDCLFEKKLTSDSALRFD